MPKEARIPKSETGRHRLPGGLVFDDGRPKRLIRSVGHRLKAYVTRAFGFRISFGIRNSEFGFHLVEGLPRGPRQKGVILNIFGSFLMDYPTGLVLRLHGYE